MVNTQFDLITSEIKNIIFDLGGVIINLSVQETYQAFSRLSNISLSEMKILVHSNSFFREYEKGHISDDQFRNELRSFLKVQVSDKELDDAWNAMLLDIPVQRIRLLEKLKSEFNLFLLSNTNNIHLQCFNAQVRQVTGQQSLDIYFHQAYYSHLVKMAKPDIEIYQHVIENNKLVPHQTLFLDDNIENLEGAKKAGIQTFHIQYPDLIFSLFP